MEHNFPKSHEVSEIPFRSSGIRFEPGVHPDIPIDQDHSLIEKVYAGDPEAHVWNREVSARMTSYQPQVIAIDGLLPGFISNAVSTNPKLDDALYTWLALPARPNKINGQGKVIVVGGDLVDYDNPLRRYDIPLLQNTKAVLRQRSESQYKVEKDNWAKDYISSLGITAALLSVLIMSQVKMSRRQFLKNALGAGLAAASITSASASIAKSGAMIVSDQTTTETGRDIALTICDLVQPRFWKQDLIDFRTALLITKIEDAISHLGAESTTPASVVMGNAHVFHALDYMRNPEARNKKIQDFSSEIAAVYDEVFAKYPIFSPQAAKGILFDHMMKTDLIQITDPGDPPYSYGLPTAIRNNMTLIASFPSPQIHKSLQIHKTIYE